MWNDPKSAYVWTPRTRVRVGKGQEEARGLFLEAVASEPFRRIL